MPFCCDTKAIQRGNRARKAVILISEFYPQRLFDLIRSSDFLLILPNASDLVRQKPFSSQLSNFIESRVLVIELNCQQNKSWFL